MTNPMDRRKFLKVIVIGAGGLVTCSIPGLLVDEPPIRVRRVEAWALPPQVGSVVFYTDFTRFGRDDIITVRHPDMSRGVGNFRIESIGEWEMHDGKSHT